MDNEVLEFDIGLGGGGEGEYDDDGGDIEHPMDEEELGDSSGGGGVSSSIWEIELMMDNEVLEFDIGLGGGGEGEYDDDGGDIEHPMDEEELGDSSGGGGGFYSGRSLEAKDDLDTNIRKLLNELESANRKCEIYRSNLLSVLKAVEDHKLELSVKVENIKISMKDGI
ncbi:hypothetical protein DEO72_LG7g3198 [Vigna unguiculata]|uniref:Uncharacterized protein n=1 Tax=Vigna unguiculata TaxID=3917 RepID=A0A4D6MLL9_VIGUN|nr:hypothetical protein DEO72_LG7g3198 [Vigna unguiculata]